MRPVIDETDILEHPSPALQGEDVSRVLPARALACPGISPSSLHPRAETAAAPTGMLCPRSAPVRNAARYPGAGTPRHPSAGHGRPGVGGATSKTYTGGAAIGALIGCTVGATVDSLALYTPAPSPVYVYPPYPHAQYYYHFHYYYPYAPHHSFHPRHYHRW